MMKTTLNIDCDVWEMLKTYANRRSITPGEAASDLPKGSPKITSEHVKPWLEDLI
jgi:hypothetical protein